MPAMIVTSSNPIVVTETTPLAISGVFTSQVLDTAGLASVNTFIHSDQASAASGVVFEWSTDGTNWDLSDVSPDLVAATALTAVLVPKARYFRVVLTNGAVIQATFRLQLVGKLV